MLRSSSSLILRSRGLPQLNDGAWFTCLQGESGVRECCALAGAGVRVHAHLQQPRLALPIEQHIKTEDLKAREANVVVTQQRVIDVIQMWLDGEEGFHD